MVSPCSTIARSLSPPLLDTSDGEWGTSSAALLHHFQESWRTVFALPHAGNVLPLCQGRPHLYNTVLAVAACHLRHHSPDPGHHRVAEHFRQSLAFQGFQGALSRPLLTLGPNEVGIVILNAVLLNLLAFVLPAEEDPSPAAGALGEGADPTKSWVFSNRPDRLNWLGVQLGLKPLLMETRPVRGGVRLGPVFNDPDDKRGAFSQGGIGPEYHVPDVWLSAFGMNRDQTHHSVDAYESPQSQASPKRIQDLASEELDLFLYLEPLRSLSVIKDIEPTDVNFHQYLQFPGTIGPEFQTRLYERDEKAMWVFGYWLGLMCRFEHIWWCGRRVRRDFTAIVIWLRASGVTLRPGRDGLLWTAMIADLEDSPFWPPGSSLSPALWGGKVAEVDELGLLGLGCLGTNNGNV